MSLCDFDFVASIAPAESLEVGASLLEYAGSLIVEDASGCRFQLYEFRGRRFLRPVRRFELDTGEAVQRVDFDNYVVAKTGETLVRVEPSLPSLA